MAQIEKYNFMQALAIIAHCERTGATHSNKCIDMSRTRENFALWPPDNPDRLIFDIGVEGQSSARYAAKRLQKRLREVSCLKRSDVNVLCDWCIHLGVDVPPGYESKMDFYRAAVRIMAERYGSENVVYAWVHEDETSSHLHFGFIPVVQKALKLRSNASQKTREAYEKAVREGKTVVERVDAAAVINRKHLQEWHGWMSKQLTTDLGYNPGIYTGVTKFLGGNMRVSSLKQTGPNWREKRNKRVEAFHNARRERQRGRKAALADQIAVSDPKVRNLQGVSEGKKRSLSEMMASAEKKKR